MKLLDRKIPSYKHSDKQHATQLATGTKNLL